VGRILTLTYTLGKLDRRLVSIDLWSPPHSIVGNDTNDIQQWFLALLGMIWWDIENTVSFVQVTHVADAMVSIVKRERVDWEDERHA
jgi:hypothetical protein